MLRVDRVRFGYVLPVPSRIACLVSTDKKYTGTPRIERIEDPVGSAFMLNAQFTHIRESRVPNSIRVGPSECRALFFKQAHSKIDAVLLVG